ncbi:NUDIX domain-containing protein [Paenibacillus odorifer]|uniref:NUDIX domain-containing protein n=1 Tax=Paenibacillus odorifer TaxID=189426 RepID=UPI0035E3E403
MRRSLREAGISARPEKHWMAAEHIFSHIVWTLQVYRCSEEDALPLPIAAEGRAVYNAEADLFSGIDSSMPIERFEDGTASPEDGGAVRWISREDMANYAFPNVFLKLLNLYFDEQEERAKLEK